MANAVSLLRLALAVPFGLTMRDPSGASAPWAALLLVLAIASDLLDGALARRRGTESRLGGILDHGADFAFVMTGLAALAARGGVPWLLPGLVAFAFAQYVVDSFWSDRRRGLRVNRLGRLNGILYFVPLGGDILARLAWPPLALGVRWLAWALVGSTLLSMASRTRAWARHRRRAPGSHA